MVKNRGIALLFALVAFFGISESADSQDLMTVIKSHNDLSSFANAIEANGLESELSGKGPYTVFAPINEIFDKEISGKNLSSSSVRNLLLNHIMTGYATERNMKVMSKATSLGGITLALKTDGNVVKINEAEIIKMNIKARNGVLHIIRGVLK